MPVLALTANAMSTDRQACLDAGMNEHVPKPIRPVQLRAALDRWLGPDAGLPAELSPDANLLEA